VSVPETSATAPASPGAPQGEASGPPRQPIPLTPLSRRGFLRAAGSVGLAAAAIPLMESLTRTIAAAAPPAMSAAPVAATHRWVMVIDLRRCDGCGQCTLACQQEHYLEPDQEWIKVFEMSSSSGAKYFMPRPCMQCQDPPCLRVCPTGATFANADGMVLVDQDRCIGCRMCMAACPYGARYFNWTDPTVKPPLGATATPEHPTPQRKGTVGKCVFCVQHLAMGRLPACVAACGMQALWIGDLNADLATNGQETVRLSSLLKDNDAVRYKEELNTRPSVYYILGHGQDLEY
jgi:molybdopterin-containing oxidoreductase family iron-sulfur binding subunit